MPRINQQLYDLPHFDELFDRLRRKAAPPLPGPAQALDAVGLVDQGLVVPCGHGPLDPPATDASEATGPHSYRLRHWLDSGGEWAAVNDRLEIDLHGLCSATHIDTLDHFYWKGQNFAGLAVPDCTHQDLSADALPRLAQGIVGRGVLLDVPGLSGGLRPDQVMTANDVELALSRAHIERKPGDILFVNYGRNDSPTSLDILGEYPISGFDLDCADLLAQWAPPIIVTESGFDPFPTQVPGIYTPFHILLIAGMGIHLVDNADLAGLTATCRKLGRYEFLCVMAPTNIRGASSSLLNPLAIF